MDKQTKDGVSTATPTAQPPRPDPQPASHQRPAPHPPKEQSLLSLADVLRQQDP